MTLLLMNTADLKNQNLTRPPKASLVDFYGYWFPQFGPVGAPCELLDYYPLKEF